MVVAGLKITMMVTAMRREVQVVACKVDQELPVGEEEVLPADQELLVATAEVIKGNRLSIKNQEEAHANPVSTDVKKIQNLRAENWKHHNISFEFVPEIIVLDEMKKACCLFTRRYRGLTLLCNPWNLCFLEAYRDQEPSPDHSSGSESGSESSGSQSPSSSGSSSSSEEGSREGSVHGALPPPEPPQSLIRSSSLCLRNILARSGGRVAFFFSFQEQGSK